MTDEPNSEWIKVPAEVFSASVSPENRSMTVAAVVEPEVPDEEVTIEVSPALRRPV